MDYKQQETWLKAAVIGSIWATFEIVFGSLFHSLRLPFAGTFLTFFAIVLLSGFSYKWNGKNLFIKAGLITALLRSLMPTSVILGPLIGILLEAFIFQLSINIFRRNIVAFTFAGILAMFSAILHRIISVIIIYGFDIVKILENLYLVLLKSTHINLPINQLITIVIIAYTLGGLLAGFTGKHLGTSILKAPKINQKIIEKWEIKSELFNIQHFKYRYFYIIIHILVLIVVLFSLEFFSLLHIILPILLYLSFLIYRYGKSLRRLAKPIFWIQLVIIVLMAVWLWQDKTQGLLIGLKMIIRAILVVSVFTAISVELKNPLVKALLYKRGYAQLYATFGLATSAVPFILKNVSKDKKTLLNPLKTMRKSIQLSDMLLNEFKDYSHQKNKIFIISGEIRSGKTTFLKKVIQDLQQNHPNKKIGGIIAHGIDKNNERFGFNIENIANQETAFLCSQTPDKDAQKLGRFYFSPQGIAFGQKALTKNIKELNLLVIDEIGFLELKGKGWFDAIELAMQQPHLNMIWVVRKSILENVLQVWQHNQTMVIDINDDKTDIENLTAQIFS